MTASGFLQGLQFRPTHGNRRCFYRIRHFLILQKSQHQIIEQLGGFDAANMSAILNHREPHVFLKLGEALGCSKENVVLATHDDQALLHHRPVDVIFDQMKERFIQLNPLQVFARGQPPTLATEDVAAQSMIPPRQDNKAKQPIKRLVRQDERQQFT